MKSIFPKEILDYTSELYRYNFLKRSQAIYMILLISLLLIGVALPFIKIDLYTTSPGMIRPSKARNLITSPINGKINDVRIVENSSVKEGDTLVVLDDSSISQELVLIEEQTDTLKLYIQDLKLMCHDLMVPSDSLSTTLGKSLFQQYEQKLKDLQAALNREHFVRVHHSHIVNLIHARKFVKKYGGQLVLSTGDIIDVSRSKKKTLFDKLTIV